MQETITIVSGLPRSGTSMVMRMLEAGGMDIVVDHVRKPDEDNPVGYFEFEKVKKIKKDASWLNAIKGKAIKVISKLLYDLPSKYQYKVIFMTRNMDEMLKSQRKMLERRGVADDSNDEEMARFFQEHLADIEGWLRDRTYIQVLYVDYNDAVSDALESAQRINEFLGHTLDVEKMVMAVDKSLYRNRRSV
jgi:hypothetical protein